MTGEDLYFCGDVHGKYRELVWTLCVKRNIRDASIIILGDFGVGFTRDMDIEYKKKSRNKRNGVLQRANH